MENNKQKILIIEDDFILAENVKDILEEENFNVEISIDGRNGLELAEKWHPDLIICDIAMPNMDGYEVLEAISDSEKLKGIPFIYLTAKVEKDNFRRGMRLGADDYIFKPFDVNDLINSVKIRLKKAAKIASNESGPLIEDDKYSIDDKIMLKVGSNMHLVAIKNLKTISSETPYVNIKLISGRCFLQRGTLNEWESKLPPKNFIRIHRSLIINFDFVDKIDKLENSTYKISMKDEMENFVASKRYSAKLKERLS